MDGRRVAQVARLGVLVCLVLIGCTNVPSFSLRDDPTIERAKLCAIGAAIPPVSGELEGDQTAAPDYVWLRDGSNRRLFLVWPGGFHVKFSSPLQVVNADGELVAQGGDLITLPQVIAVLDSGTQDNPYRVVGQLVSELGTHCYQPIG